MTVARRHVLAALLGALGTAACGGTQKALAPPPAAPAPLVLEPLVDLVPSAGLEWLVEAHPQQLLGNRTLAALVAALATDDQFDTFARRHGGVDLRRADEIAVAGQSRGMLGLARIAIEPRRVEAAFTDRARAVEGRAIERGVTRFWGTVGDEREQVALFGHDAVGVERGALGPLQAAIYFAQRRLKRALPALRVEPLVSAAGRLGTAPVRAFAPGPFEGEWARGLGGLLGATTALGARLTAEDAHPPGIFSLRIVLMGAWDADSQAAGERLGAAFRVLAEDPLGRLTGLDRPVSDPVVTADSAALALDVALDPVRMLEGVRAAMSAPVAEIMAF